MKLRSPAALAIAACLLSSPAWAQDLGSYQSQRTDGRAIVIVSSNGAQLRITPYGDQILRVQVARPGETFLPERTPDMVERHDWPGAITADDRSDRLEIGAATAGAAQLVLTKTDLGLSFGLAGENETRLSGGRVTFDGPSTTIGFDYVAAEHFAGLGHGFFGRVPKLDLAGATHVRHYGRMHGEQSPLIVPFYLSSRGYGVFVNAAFDVTFQLGEAARYAITQAEGQLDVFLLAGPRLLDLLDRYTALTGRPRLPPRAMFGLALSDKGAPDISDAAWWQANVAKHRALGLPLDHLINDNRWRAGGGERCLSRFAWDPTRYPDPAAFERWLTAEGLVATLDFNRCIAAQSDGWRPEFNLPGTDQVEFGDSSPDLTRPEVRRWWWDLILRMTADPALGYPHDGLWIDEFDENGAVPDDTITGDGRRWAEVRNLWFLYVAEALGAEGWDQSIGPAERPFIWVRGMTAGGQRAATLWSGDLDSSYGEMQLQIRGMQAAGLSGFPFWGHDAGGFNAEGLDEATFDVLYRQWALAFGSFTPYWKPHGVGPLRWPMDRSPAAQVLAERYAGLRMALMPYLYSYAVEAALFGAPMARPLLLEYGNDDRAWTYDLEYLWGRELLVTPVPNAGDAPVSVWLPEWPNGGWYDFWTDDVYPAGGVIEVFASPGRIPIFVKAGSIVPMEKPADSAAFLRDDVLDLHVYPGADARFTLAEDDGRSEAYRTGAIRRTVIDWSQTEKLLRIHAAEGTFAGAGASRRYRVEFHGVAAAPCASIGGETAAVYHSRREAEAHGVGAYPMTSARSSGIGVVTRPTAVSGEITIRLGGLCLADPIRRFQAEGGRTSGAIGRKATASGGTYVGGLETPDSFVEIDVSADTDGDHELAIGFANGSATWASRALYVNGVAAGDVVFPPSSDWWMFERTAYRPIRLNAGANTIRIQTDPGDRATADLDYLEIIDGPPRPAPPFEAQAGLLVVEAEHFFRATEAGGHAFVPITRPHGYAGDGAVIAQPDVEELREAAQPEESPRLDYPVSLEPGTYSVWIRGHAYGDGDDDSVHLGIDGAIAATADRITFTDARVWTWTRSTMDGPNATLEVGEPGVHTISLWMREDGAVIDRLLLSADPAFVPDAEGPPESPRAGEPVEPPDAGTVDAASSTDDAGALADAGAAADAGVTGPPDGKACGCRTADRSAGGGIVFGLLALALLLRRR